MQVRPSPAWTLALTSVAFVMVTLDALVVVTALPAIHRDLGANLSTLEWTVNAFTLAFAAGIITAAALGDRFGRLRIFTLGLSIFTLASVACALAPTATILVAARAVQGLGAAMVMPLSLTILMSAFPAERRGAVVGIWGGLGGLGVASGPLVGGALTQGLDWHWIFWINVPIGVVAVMLSWLRLSESRGPATRIDLPAVALVSAAATAIVWGLVRAGEDGWRSPVAIAALATGAGLAAAFVAWERRATDPMLPIRLFSSRGFATANATGFLMAGAIFSAAFLIFQYMQFALGFTPLAAGLRLLPWTAAPLVVAPLAGMLADRVGTRPVMAAGMLLQGIGLGWFALLATTSAVYGELVLPLIVAGVGISMALPIVPTAIMNSVAPKDMGKASGVNSTMQRFGSAFAIAIASAVFASNGHIGTAFSFDAGFRPALAMVAGLSLVGALTAVAGVSVRRQPANAHDVPAVSSERAA
jgi:EmrB/QacA subfamily drug resistance transporter